MTNGFAQIVPAPWGYRGDPPFRVISTSLPGDELLGLHYFDTLSEATAWFVRFHVGPVHWRNAGIVDANDQIVIGYRALGQVDWFGTAAAFAELALHHDPMTVAVWESQSCGGVDPYEIPADVVPWTSP